METLQQLVEKIESCAFECEAGPLIMCIDWLKLKAKIEESAATQDTKPQVEKCKASVPPASAADPYGTDSEGWSKNPNHWANKESAPAQSSTADRYEIPPFLRKGDNK